MVAVLLVPVLPDVFVEVWGEGPAPRDASLRALAVAFVLAILFGYLILSTWWQRRQTAKRASMVQGLGHADIVVLPLGRRPRYEQKSSRGRATSVYESIIDACKPRLAVLVTDPDGARGLTPLQNALFEDGVESIVVPMDDVMDPRYTIEVGASLIVSVIKPRLSEGDQVYVDTTGGTIPMSLSMVRLASALECECVYVSAEYDRTGALIRGSDKAHRFYPELISNGALQLVDATESARVRSTGH